MTEKISFCGYCQLREAACDDEYKWLLLEHLSEDVSLDAREMVERSVSELDVEYENAGPAAACMQRIILGECVTFTMAEVIEGGLSIVERQQFRGD